MSFYLCLNFEILLLCLNFETRSVKINLLFLNIKKKIHKKIWNKFLSKFEPQGLKSYWLLYGLLERRTNT